MDYGKMIKKRLTESAAEARSWPDSKELTYREAQQFAMAYYSKGGDAFYETWEEYQFNDHVKQFGPMTVKDMKSMFLTQYNVQKDMEGSGQYQESKSVSDDRKFAIEYDFHNVAKSGEPAISNHIKKVEYASTKEEAEKLFDKLLQQSKKYDKSYICIGAPLFISGDSLADIVEKYKIYRDGKLVKDETPTMNEEKVNEVTSDDQSKRKAFRKFLIDNELEKQSSRAEVQEMEYLYVTGKYNTTTLVNDLWTGDAYGRSRQEIEELVIKAGLIDPKVDQEFENVINVLYHFGKPGSQMSPTNYYELAMKASEKYGFEVVKQALLDKSSQEK